MSIFESWDCWSETPIGAWLLEQEQYWMDTNLEDVFGYNAIQIGPSKLDSLRSNRIQCKARLCFEFPVGLKPNHSNIIVIPQDFIPLESQTIDLFVLSHVLETVKNPHQLLREVERVLIPEGKLIINSFNPISLWSIYKKFKKDDFFVTNCELIGIKRLKDWCELLNLKIIGGEFSTYLPPVNSAAWIRKLAWMEQAGSRWWPTTGAIYYLTAIKRNNAMNLIQPKKWKSPKFKKQTAASIGKTSSIGLKNNEF